MQLNETVGGVVPPLISRHCAGKEEASSLPKMTKGNRCNKTNHIIRILSTAAALQVD